MSTVMQSGTMLGSRGQGLIRETEHDTYKQNGTLADPSACGECSAVYQAGRWGWSPAPPDAPRTTCPACHRVRDDYPAGSVFLNGSFARDHGSEILGLAEQIEKRERAEHPLRRIISARKHDDAIVIHTTDLRLTRVIGEAIHRHWDGEIESHYCEEADLLRVHWSR